MRITEPESMGLTVWNANDTLKEFMGPRADDDEGKRQLFNNISENGYANMKDIESGLQNKTTLNTIDMFFLAAGVANDLVTPGYATYRTLNDTKQRKSSQQKMDEK